MENHLLRTLPPADLECLQPHLERFELPLRAGLEYQGQPIEWVHFIESGMVSLVLKTPEHQLEVGIIGREGMTGYWMLLNKDPAPYDGFVQAEGASLRLRIKDFLACLEERPQLRSHFLLFVWKLMLQTAQTALANGRCTTEERLARWILMTRDRLESDDFPLTHEFLSLMLGVHRPAVTIALQALEGVGAIRNPRRRITIVDREKLEDIAGTAYTPNGRSAD